MTRFQEDEGEQNSEQDEDFAAPEANAYEFQSNGVVDMLSKLQDKFTDEKTKMEKEEVNARNAYQLLLQDLNAQVDEALNDKHGKQLNRAKKLASKADEKGDKKDEEQLEVEDTHTLKDLKASCEMKASDFKARQQMRSEEIEAIEQAIEIISGNAVKGNAEKHLPGLVQTQATALAQLRSDSSLNSGMQQRLSMFLHARAKKVNSRILALAAQHAAADPFKKVKKMLKDLVVRLMEEANE